MSFEVSTPKDPRDLEIIKLNDRINELLDLLGAKERDRLTVLGFTPSEAIILSMLLHNVIVSSQSMHTILYSDRWVAARPDIGILRVLMTNIRHKLDELVPGGAIITTAKGYGYSLSAKGQELLKARMEQITQ